MANHVSSIKRIRTTAKRTEINRMRKTRMRHSIRAMRRALETKDAANAAVLLPKTFSMIDRAARWGLIKVNTAARYKSRMHTRLKDLAKA